MTHDVVKFAFVAGEIAENYYARTDLEKYDLALALADNWFIDYRGGISTRAGFEFCDYIEADDKDVKLIPFKFSLEIANTNLIVLGHNYARFMQDGGYVLEDSFAITAASQANPATLTAAGNDFAVGDWVKVSGIAGMDDHNGQLYVVASVGATFSLNDVYGAAINSTGFSAYISGGAVARVVRLTMPYAATDLADLRFHQIRDTIRLTHPRFPVYNLVRQSTSAWEISEENFDRTIGQPSITSHSVPTASTYGCAYVVTAVDKEGQESLPSWPHFVTDAQDPVTVAAWSVQITWTPVVGAVYYKVYRTRIVRESNLLNQGMEFGYIGKARGGNYVDQLVAPAFNLTPPRTVNPFENGVITNIYVDTPGDGYDRTALIVATDSNPAAGGFLAMAVVDTIKTDITRPIVGVIILNGGHDYTNPSFSVSGGGAGSGATFSADVTGQEGNYPSNGGLFQQRQLYAGKEVSPLVLNGSKPGQLNNFDESDILVADDAYEFEVDSEDASPIIHLVDTRGGLLMISASGIWQLQGAGGVVSATNALAEPQTYKGSTKLPPLKVDTSIIYAEVGAVKYLAYNDTNKLYSGTDVSILSNHLITPQKQMTSWGYADEPFKLIAGRRSDGVMLNLVLLRDQDVYGWTRSTTRGLFYDICALQEGILTSIYAVVTRIIGGRARKYIERMDSRQFETIEEAFCVDAGLRLGAVYPAAGITIDVATGTATVMADADIFTAADVGKVIRAGGGKMYVTDFIDANELRVNIVLPITDLIPQISPSIPSPLASGAWTMDTPITVLKGLGHLEGETIQVLADGNVVKDLVVANKRVTLPVGATRVAAGIGFRCLAKTLPPIITTTSIEGKRKNIKGLVVRIKDTRGLKHGIADTAAQLYEMKERKFEPYGEPTLPQGGLMVETVDGAWEEDSPVFFVQDNPLPATILGYVQSVEVGDDDDN